MPRELKEPSDHRTACVRRRRVCMLLSAAVMSAVWGLVVVRAADEQKPATQNKTAKDAPSKPSLFSAITGARVAAKRTQDTNNLKQILLALHNYNDANGHFPPATVLGPDGKTVHSWRVAILPYLDQAALYGEYKLDESWDSENNKKVLAKIPAVYRSPFDKADSKNSSYFGFTGEHTVFGSATGMTLGGIRDGTSNTIAVVEAKRDVPWTKPEDLPYDAGKPVPEPGGWDLGETDSLFRVGMCDGSVRQLKTPVAEISLRALITVDGGEIPE